jgi:hypothetical protein
MDLNRNIYEGYTPDDFIQRIRPQFYQRLAGRGFKDKKEMIDFVCGEQPFYKKQVPEVISYFWSLLKPILAAVNRRSARG